MSETPGYGGFAHRYHRVDRRPVSRGRRCARPAAPAHPRRSRRATSGSSGRCAHLVLQWCMNSTGSFQPWCLNRTIVSVAVLAQVPVDRRADPLLGAVDDLPCHVLGRALLDDLHVEATGREPELEHAADSPRRRSCRRSTSRRDRRRVVSASYTLSGEGVLTPTLCRMSTICFAPLFGGFRDLVTPFRRPCCVGSLRRSA